MSIIAFLSPLPPAETGIASYAAAVLDGLREIGVADRHRIDPIWPVDHDAKRRVREADVAVYQLGNNVEFHGDIYRLSVEHPGVTVLHDLALDGLMWGLGVERSPLAGPARAEAIAAVPPGATFGFPLNVPWCAQAVRRSRAVIVHSRFARDYLVRIGCRTPVVVAPHPIVETAEAVDRARARSADLHERLVAGDEVVVGIAGDLNASKGIAETIAALEQLPPTIRLLLVGRTGPHWQVDPVVRESRMADRVTVVKDPSDDDFLAWLCAVDVLVNVRHPHRGETSGSLVRALQLGIPTIVSAIGSYLDVPDDIVGRIPPGPPDPAALAASIGPLAADASARAAMGDRARAYASEAFAPRVTAEAYASAIDGVLALAVDLRRLALARWAGALRSTGVEPGDAARGFGLRYAEGLAEFGHPS